MNEGSLVIHRSGGPIMTLDHILDGYAYCVWFVEQTLHTDKFLLEDLIVENLEGFDLSYQ